METIIQPDADTAAAMAARPVSKPDAVLGLATGSTRQLQTISLGSMHIKNQGLKVLKRIAKVPTDPNAQIAKLKLLHLASARANQSKRDGIEPPEASVRKNGGLPNAAPLLR